jgi:cytoskeleton protein RodZ
MSARPGPGSPGVLLRMAREGLGLSIEEVADRLRLGEALVLAMEEDRFGLLGAPVFARGYLRNYAALVGAPEQQVLEAFDVGELPEPILLPAGERIPVARSHGRWIAALVVLAAAAGGVAWWLARS